MLWRRSRITRRDLDLKGHPTRNQDGSRAHEELTDPHGRRRLRARPHNSRKDPPMSQLHYETVLVRREGLTWDLPAGNNTDLRWVANSATLIFGDHDAVLVDTFTTIEQNERLIEWVKAHGRNLTHIYLTHGHGDHVYGIGQLLQAFPRAQAVATA